MELIDLINDLEKFRNKGFRDCNVEKILLRLKKIENDKKVKIPKFVADWIKYSKNTFLSLSRALMVKEIDFYNYANQEDHSKIITFLESGIDQEIFIRAWLDGYEVEQEKRYLVKIIGISDYNSYLNYRKEENKWTMESCMETDAIRTKHTRKELEDAGFGEVFNSPLFEVEEVE